MVRHIFAIFLGGATFLPSFWWCDIFVIFNFVWGFLSSFEATTFLPFSGISYFRGEENFGPRVCKNSELKVGSSWGENGEIQTKN